MAVKITVPAAKEELSFLVEALKETKVNVDIIAPEREAIGVTNKPYIIFIFGGGPIRNAGYLVPIDEDYLVELADIEKVGELVEKAITEMQTGQKTK